MGNFDEESSVIDDKSDENTKMIPLFVARRALTNKANRSVLKQVSAKMKQEMRR
jgi:hypothetical protein